MSFQGKPKIQGVFKDYGNSAGFVWVIYNYSTRTWNEFNSDLKRIQLGLEPI